MRAFDLVAKNEQQAASYQFRADLISIIRDLTPEINQNEIGELLGVPQPRVSELLRGKFDKFSTDKLIGFLV